MKILSNLVATAFALTTCAWMLLACRHMVDQLAATAPHFASPIGQAEFWTRAFGW